MIINKNKLFEKYIGDQKFFDDEVKNRQINFLALHHTQANSVNEAIDFYKQHGVSPHYLIDIFGQIFLLVDEQYIAFHAGCSYWRKTEVLNNSSIGIEFLSRNPYEIGFSKNQIDSGLFLCIELIKKYDIKPYNIVGHSDIAYFSDTKLLGRKDDPSHLFDWQFLAKNGVGIFHEVDLEKDVELFRFGQRDQKIGHLKQYLREFGYLVTNFDEIFDEEMIFLVQAFNRRFNPKKFVQNSEIWYLSCDLILQDLLKRCY